MNFKTQLERDLQEVFHNSAEMAEVVEFWIGGTRYKGPVVLDDCRTKDRESPYTDHVYGLSFATVVLSVPLSLLKKAPGKGQTVEIGSDTYTIAKVSSEAGEIILYLEMLTE